MTFSTLPSPLWGNLGDLTPLRARRGRNPRTHPISIGTHPKSVRSPRMWEQAHVGFGGTGRKRKGPCTKQCAWWRHGSSDTRLAEACPPKLRNTVKYRVEEMRPKWPFLEVPCAQNALGRSTMRPPEALLPRNPTWESPHFSGLTNRVFLNLGFGEPRLAPQIANLAVWFAVSILIELSSNIPTQTNEHILGRVCRKSSLIAAHMAHSEWKMCDSPMHSTSPQQQNRDCLTLGSQLSRTFMSV